MRFANQEAYENYQANGGNTVGGGKGSAGGYSGTRAIPARINVKDVNNALQGYQQRLDNNNPNPQSYLQPANVSSSYGNTITPSIQTISPVADVAQQPMQADLTNSSLPTNTSVAPQPRGAGYTPNPYTVDPVRPVPAMQTPRGAGYTPNPYTVDPVRPVQGLTLTSTTMGGGK